MKSVFQLLFLLPLTLNAQTADWITVRSPYSAEKTVATLQQAILEKGFKLFATINHSQEAENAGLTLRPTVLLIFGNPKAGTALMNCDPRIGIDLPLKVIVWEQAEGTVMAGFINPESFSKEYHLENCKEVLPKMKSALQNLLAPLTKEH